VYAAQQQEDNQVNHRYGADMRLITAITLIFLPATFVATFFSTSFWDFAPENKGAKVSRWVWLYAVVTIGLTLMVLGIWLNFDALVGLPVTVRKLLFGTMWKFTREQRKELKEAMELEKRRRREH
jgi:magnesium-transporting ATPase (P-type)